jgi:hypothetical protein
VRDRCQSSVCREKVSPSSQISGPRYVMKVVSERRPEVDMNMENTNVVISLIRIPPNASSSHVNYVGSATSRLWREYGAGKTTVVRDSAS